MVAAASTSTTVGLAGDTRALQALRNGAAKDPKLAVREAARQFEALFMQEILKSMRATTMSTGLADNEGTKLGTEMLDQQFATRMAGAPGGLSDLIARQLERQMGLHPGPIPPARRANENLSPIDPPGLTPRIPERSTAAYIEQHDAAARAAESATGIPAAFMLAQSALETGWGRREIVGGDGTPSNNLFGIKAGANWKGPVVEATTTEYVGDRPQKVVQRFRAYASAAESFADYARLIKDSPRYQSVIAAGADAHGFASSLQRAGYATDPAYADKLARVIATTLRLQRGQA
jgi:flagellar protein FlgJ